MSSAWSVSGGLRPPTNPLTRGFTPGPHWVLRPQTHTIATAKQSCVCTEIYIYSYENAQKLLPLELLLLAQIYAPNRLSAGALPQTHWGSLHRSPRPPSWFRGGAHGERGRWGEKEGGKGREGRGGRPGMPKSRVGKLRQTLMASVNSVKVVLNNNKKLSWCWQQARRV